MVDNPTAFDKRPNPVRRKERALHLILANEPELFCDLSGEPCIRLPKNTTSPSPTWSLRSDRVRFWIADFIFDNADLVLTEHEITNILTVLVGKACHDERTDVDLHQAMDQDPFVEALFIYLRENGNYDGNCSKLLSKLCTIATACGTDIKSKGWPKGAAQLSHRLSTLKDLIAKAGVTLEIGRNGGRERFVRLRQMKCDDVGVVASQTLTIDKAHHPRQLPCQDARDAACDDPFSHVAIMKEDSNDRP